MWPSLNEKHEIILIKDNHLFQGIIIYVRKKQNLIEFGSVE